MNDKIMDALPELEARVAFVSAASLAFSMLPEAELAVVSSSRAWEGLFWLTREIGEKLEELAKAAR